MSNLHKGNRHGLKTLSRWRDTLQAPTVARTEVARPLRDQGGALVAEAQDSRPVATKSASVIQRKILSRVDVPDSKYEVIYALVDIAANSTVARHTHPGTVMGYLLAGDYGITVDGSPQRAVQVGESFAVPAGAVHEEKAGAHPVRLLVVFTVRKGEPLASPAP